MKIGIGVCGIGHGHTSRQKEIADSLGGRGHEVHVFGWGPAMDVFRDAGYPVETVWVPIVPPTRDGVSLLGTIRQNAGRALGGIAQNRRVRERLWKEGVPDVFVTDYDPITARFAYTFDRPLLTVDQQSKYVFFDFGRVDGLGPGEYIERGRLMFPRADHHFVPSFFKIAERRPGVTVIPPPLPAGLVPVASESPLILVYFSNFLGTTIRQTLADILEIFGRFPAYEFVLYSKTGDVPRDLPTNVSIRRHDRAAFLHDLSRCRGVVSTAGHTLMAEAFSVGKPFLAIPIVTYDQHFCAAFVAANGLGHTARELTPDVVGRFLDDLPRLSAQIAASEILNFEGDGAATVIDYVEAGGWRA